MENIKKKKFPPLSFPHEYRDCAVNSNTNAMMTIIAINFSTIVIFMTVYFNVYICCIYLDSLYGSLALIFL